MNKSTSKKLYAIATLGMLLAMVLGACSAPPQATQDVASIQTQAAKDTLAQITANAPAPVEVPPTQAPAPVPTVNPNLPVAVIPTAVPGQPGVVAKVNTTINSGPGDNYILYSSFLGGASAIVVGKSEDGLWWAIAVPVAPNQTGWVNGEFVTASNADSVPVLPTPPVPPTVELVPPGPDDPQATALANVYVRNGPSTAYPAYGVAPTGALARVLGKSVDSQWWVVRLNPANVGTGYGWVLAQYTSAKNVQDVPTIQTPQPAAQYVPPPPPSGAPSATAVEPVNVRSGPGTNYPVLVVAPAGATGEVTGKNSDGTWWQVKLPTQYSASGVGWVSADYVTTQNTDSVAVVEAPPPPPTVAPTPAPPSGGASSGCQLVSQTPTDGTTFTIGAPFNTTWVIKNTGTQKWSSGEYDFMFVGAANNVYLHTGPDVYDLATNVDPGATYNFTVPMLAPFGPGQFGEVWQLVLGSKPVCEFYVYITVP